MRRYIENVQLSPMRYRFDCTWFMLKTVSQINCCWCPFRRMFLSVLPVDINDPFFEIIWVNLSLVCFYILTGCKRIPGTIVFGSFNLSSRKIKHKVLEHNWKFTTWWEATGRIEKRFWWARASFNCNSHLMNRRTRSTKSMLLLKWREYVADKLMSANEFS